MTPTPAALVSDAAQRIADEIAHTYPSFQLRSLDWDKISAQHAPGVAISKPSGFQSLAAAWVAEPGDAHTSVRSATFRFNPPYRGILTTDGVLLRTVPEDSAAAAAGVGSGWVVQISDPQQILRTTGASPQHHRQVAARLALAITGSERTFTARDQTGTEVKWTERRQDPTLASTLRVKRDNRGGLNVTLSNFPDALDLSAVFDDLFAGAAPTDHLRLDLRGNTGESLLAATELRDRLLRKPTKMGSIRFTTGAGTTGAESRTQWPNTLTN